MASTVGRVSVGFISIELRAYTGEVDERQGAWRVFGDDGESVDVSYEQGLFGRAPKLGPRMDPYDQVSVFWGVRRGKDVNIIAIKNHTQESLGIIPQPFNNMIIPGAGKRNHSPLYNFFMVVAIFTGVFSVIGFFMGNPVGIVFLVPVIAFFLWIKKRQRTLRKAIEAAAAKLKPRAAAARADQAPGPAAVRI